jgi:hypothetical protein
MTHNREVWKNALYKYHYKVVLYFTSEKEDTLKLSPLFP